MVKTTPEARCFRGLFRLRGSENVNLFTLFLNAEIWNQKVSV